MILWPVFQSDISKIIKCYNLVIGYWSYFIVSIFGDGQRICNKQETLRVKDDELHQILQDMRARDSTINEIADKLQETAEAAETAASAARSIDEERRFLSSELERLKQDHEKQVEVSLLRVMITLLNP